MIKREEEMRYIDGDRQPISLSLVKRVNSLIRNECCNCDAGNCVFLEYHCPQLSAETVLCEWFRDAVLPLDQILKAEIFRDSHILQTRLCSSCGKPLVSTSNRVKYCPKCSIKVHRKQTANCKRQKRLNGSG